MTPKQLAASHRRVAREIRTSVANICKGFPREAPARRIPLAVAAAHENEARVLGGRLPK
jgi:hypothetical protein